MSAAGESVEARILSVALAHVRRDGLGRLTIVRVAEEAGMTHANVYRYFRSKTDLADHLLSDWLRELERRLADITQSPDPADDKLERFLTLLARSYAEKAGSDGHVFALLTDALDGGRIAGVRHRQRVRDLLVRVIEEGVGTRLLAGIDVRRIEHLVLDVLHRFIDPHAVARDRGREGATAPGEARRERATRLLVRGLVTGRP